jgi:hypothetical protein
MTRNMFVAAVVAVAAWADAGDEDGVLEDVDDACVANRAAAIVAFREGDDGLRDDFLLDGFPFGEAAGLESSLRTTNAITSPLFVPKKQRSVRPFPRSKTVQDVAQQVIWSVASKSS